MDSRIIFVYCLCDDRLKTLGHREAPRAVSATRRF